MERTNTAAHAAAENPDSAVSVRFRETLVVCDDQTWVWELVKSSLEKLRRPYLRLPSSVPIRQSWPRFKSAPHIIIHWENTGRSGGALVEEILGVSPLFDVAGRVVVLTSNPTHEDVVYFSELGLHSIVRLRHRDKELQQAAAELNEHLNLPKSQSRVEIAWRKALRSLSLLGRNSSPEQIAGLASLIERLARESGQHTARHLDALASLAMLHGEEVEAKKLWLEALEKNPNYYRAYNNLIEFYRETGKSREALALMQKMQALNGENVGRIVAMGEMHVELNDDAKGEHYFRQALERDSYCSDALNGLAEIRFRQGDLEESRRLLASSHLAAKTASRLNRSGIAMVKAGKFEEALNHYTKAQYVLPQQEKGCLLFYNIGLCYARWGKPEMAREFVRLALVKDPKYEKARRLLEQVEALSGKTA